MLWIPAFPPIPIFLGNGAEVDFECRHESSDFHVLKVLIAILEIYVCDGVVLCVCHGLEPRGMVSEFELNGHWILSEWSLNTHLLAIGSSMTDHWIIVEYKLVSAYRWQPEAAICMLLALEYTSGFLHLAFSYKLDVILYAFSFS